MPVHEKIEIEGSYILVWKITESTDELYDLIDERLLGDISSIKSVKTKEGLLASRAALTRLIDDLGIVITGLVKDEFGKPHFSNSDWNLSLSHTDGYVAVVLSQKKFVGIDIETKFDQAFRLRRKFCTIKELELIGQDATKAALIWSGKESIYKAYGRKKLIFAEEMKLSKWNDQRLDFHFSISNNILPVYFYYKPEYIITSVVL